MCDLYGEAKMDEEAIRFHLNRSKTASKREREKIRRHLRNAFNYRGKLPPQKAKRK